MKRDVLLYDVANPDQADLVLAAARLGLRPILAGPHLVPSARQANIDFLTWEELAPVDAGQRARRELESRRSSLVAALNRPEVRREFITRMGDVWPAVAPTLGAELSRILLHQVTTLIHLDAVRRQTNLSAIVLGCDNAPWQRAMTFAARKVNIPTLQLAHGINPPVLAHHAGDMYTVYADHVAVFGKRARESLIHSGNDPGRLHVTGAPQWDALYRDAARMDAREARRTLRLDPDRPVVLFAASYTGTASAYFYAHHHRQRACHDTFIRAADQLGSDVQILVRPHPHEVSRSGTPAGELAWLIENYQRRLSDTLGSRVTVVTTNKIESLRAADIVVFGAESTAIVEAMILERPVVVLPWVEGQPILYTSADGVVRVERDDDLFSTLHQLISQPMKRAEIVRRQNMALPDLHHVGDGQATQRVAELIARLALEARPAAQTDRRSA